jgi:O-antigen/teichoic acid export membrane protein
VFSYVASVASSYILTSRVSHVSWLGSRVRSKPLAREAWSASGAQISEIASYRLNQLILLPLIGGAALGNYAVATNVALAPAPLGHAVGAVGFKDMAAGTKDSGRASLEDSFRAAVWLAALSTLFVSLIAPFVIPLAFGREFATAVPATIVLAIGGFFVICNYVLTSGLVARGQTSRASYSHFSGFIVGMIALFALSIPFGLMGAAFASLIGFLATAIVASFYLKVGIRLWLPRTQHFRSAFYLIFRK